MGLPAADDRVAVFGRYKLLERLGAGGMAIVYRALAVDGDGKSRELVIKRVLPELCRDRQFSSMLVAEARLSARLNHPNIVQIYELGRVDEEFYLAMELVDGIDLVRLLNRIVRGRRTLPIALGCYIVCELASALAYAHDLRDNEGRPLAIVHRDVTPSNVMVTRAGGIKLLDFGVAKAAEHVRDERTRTGTLKGKVNYLSPESADGLPVDRRADVFALGIVLHECLTLRRLFKAEGDLQTLRLIREAKVAPPSTLRSEVSPELDRVVLKMLARNPDERYGDCQQLLADLLPIARALGGDTAALARYVAELPPEEPAAAAATALVDEADMDGGPTPAIVIDNLLASGAQFATPTASAAAATPAAAAASGAVASEPAAASPSPSSPAQPMLPSVIVGSQRPRWLLPAIGAATAALLLVLALVVGHHRPSAPPTTTSSTAPGMASVAASPVTAAAKSAPAAAPGVILVDTDVATARFLVDGQVVADRVSHARIVVPRAGNHELAISAARRKPYARTVTVAAGASVQLHVKLERAHGKTATRPSRGENYLVDPFGH